MEVKEVKEVKEDIGELHTAPNPWKSRQLKMLLFRVRSIMNRLLPSNFNSMVHELVDLKIDTIETQRLVALHIVNIAVDMPKLSDLIVQIIDRLELLLKYSKNNLKNGTNEQTDFIKEIIKAVEKMFQETTAHTEDGQINESEEELVIKRFRGIGLMIFIGQLFNYSLITVDFVTSCINKLFDGFYEENLEYLCHLLQIIGKKFEQTPKNHKLLCTFYCLEETIKRLEDIIANNFIFNIKPRLRCMLKNVVYMHEHYWNHIQTNQLIAFEYREKYIKYRKHIINLHTSSNPWCPKTSNLEEIPLLLRKVRGLLNRLVPAKCDVIYNEIAKLRIETKDRLSIIAKFIGKTAFETPRYIGVLVRFVYFIHFKLSNDKNLQKIFLSEFFNFVESEFFNAFDTEAISLEESELTSQELDDLEFNKRLRKCVVANLIGEIINEKIIEKCIKHFIDVNSAENFEFFYYVIFRICKKYETGPVSFKNYKLLYSFNPYIEKLQTIFKNEASENDLTKKRTLRTRCLFQNIIYHRSIDWRNKVMFDPEIPPETTYIRRDLKRRVKIYYRGKIPNSIHANFFFPYYGNFIHQK